MDEAIAAPSAGEFCRIIKDAARACLRGHWHGKAYRSHPRGVFRNGMLFANEWHTNNYCRVVLFLDPAATLVAGCQDPCSRRNPYPRPSSGETAEIYRNGAWCGPNGPWRAAVLGELQRLRTELDLHALGKKAVRSDESRARKTRAADRERLLLEAWSAHDSLPAPSGGTGAAS